MPISNTHINQSLAISQNIKEICQPLFSHFNIFNYFKLYDNGMRLHFSSDGDWQEHYYKMKYYHVAIADRAPDAYVSGYMFWDAINQNEISALTAGKDACDNFDHAHGLSICKRCKNFTEVFEFASNTQNYSINNFYLSNMDILENFVLFFKEKAAKLISSNNFLFTIEKNPAHTIIDVPKIFYSTKQNLPKSIDNSLYQPLTNRELECINWLNKGKTSVEIGLILDISKRTAEKHLANIKEKLGCHTLYQLGKTINKLGLDRFLDF